VPILLRAKTTLVYGKTEYQISKLESEEYLIVNFKFCLMIYLSSAGFFEKLDGIGAL